MTTPKLLTLDPARSLRRLLEIHAPLTLFSFLLALATVFYLVGIFADPRYISGQLAWLKPAKFGLSILIYTLTITWMLGFVQTDRPWKARLVGILGWLIVITFVLELIPITLQTVRGVSSHFNVATAFDAFWWGVMAVSIVVLWLVNVVIAGLLLFERFENPTLALSLRLGLIITLVGMAQGFLMTSPTAQQLAGMQAGERPTFIGAHAVGVADGGAGLPGLGWSTAGGDLRVGHFVGMHALQLLPLLGLFLSRRRRLSLGQQKGLVWTAAAAYAALVVLVTWQALRAQALTAPDALTAGVFASIVVATVGSSLFILRGQAGEG